MAKLWYFCTFPSNIWYTYKHHYCKKHKNGKDKECICNVVYLVKWVIIKQVYNLCLYGLQLHYICSVVVTNAWHQGWIPQKLIQFKFNLK